MTSYNQCYRHDSDNDESDDEPAAHYPHEDFSPPSPRRPNRKKRNPGGASGLTSRQQQNLTANAFRPIPDSTTKNQPVRRRRTWGSGADRKMSDESDDSTPNFDQTKVKTSAVRRRENDQERNRDRDLKRAARTDANDAFSPPGPGNWHNHSTPFAKLNIRGTSHNPGQVAASSSGPLKEAPTHPRVLLQRSISGVDPMSSGGGAELYNLMSVCPKERLDFVTNLAALLRLNLPSRLDKTRSDKEYEQKARKQSQGVALGAVRSMSGEVFNAEEMWWELQEKVRGLKDCELEKQRAKASAIVGKILDFGIPELEAASFEREEGRLKDAPPLPPASVMPGEPSSVDKLRITQEYLHGLKHAMTHVDEIIGRVNQLESAFSSSSKLVDVCPDFGSYEVQSRLQTLYSWRSIVRQLNDHLQRVCRQLGLEDCTSVVAIFVAVGEAGGAGREGLTSATAGTNGAAVGDVRVRCRGNRTGVPTSEELAVQRLSVIYVPYETYPTSCSDAEESASIHSLSGQTRPPDNQFFSGGEISPHPPSTQDSSLATDTGFSRARLGRSSLRKHPPHQQGSTAAPATSSSASNSPSLDRRSKHASGNHLSHYQQLQSCNSLESLDISQSEHRETLYRHWAESRLKRLTVKKIMDNLYRLIHHVMPEAHKSLSRYQKPNGGSLSSAHSYADTLRRPQPVKAVNSLRRYVSEPEPLASSHVNHHQHQDPVVEGAGSVSDEEEDRNAEVLDDPPFTVPFTEWRNKYGNQNGHPAATTPLTGGQGPFTSSSSAFTPSSGPAIGTSTANQLVFPNYSTRQLKEPESSRFGVWSDEFKAMRLPSFLPQYVFLARVPLDVVHQCLKIVLQQKDKVKDLSLPTLPYVIRECKEALKCGVHVRQLYRSHLASCVTAAHSTEDELDAFENDLHAMLRLYLECLQTLMSRGYKLKEAPTFESAVEKSWKFVKKYAPLIRDGKAETAKRFCDLATDQLDAIGYDLSKNVIYQQQLLWKKVTEHEESLGEEEDDNSLDKTEIWAQATTPGTTSNRASPSCEVSQYRSSGTSSVTAGYHKVYASAFKKQQTLFNETRMRMLKAINYAKTLRQDLAIAADLDLKQSEDETPYLTLLEKLNTTGHVLIVMDTTAEEGPGIEAEAQFAGISGEESPCLTMEASRDNFSAVGPASYGIFVPKEMTDSDDISDLLQSIFGMAEDDSSVLKKSSARDYLLIIKGDPKDWKGERFCISSSVDHMITLSHIETTNLMLMARNGRRLDQQLRIFLADFKDLVHVVNAQTACHKSIAEAISELQQRAHALGTLIHECLEVVKNMLEEESVDTCCKGKYKDSVVSAMDSCFSVGFAYFKELIRLTTGPPGWASLMPTLLLLFEMWRQFAMKHHDSGHGKIPRWANDGCDFICNLFNQPAAIAEISEEQWAKFKDQLNHYVMFLVGQPPGNNARGRSGSSAASSGGTGHQRAPGGGARLGTTSNSPATVLEDEELSISTVHTGTPLGGEGRHSADSPSYGRSVSEQVGLPAQGTGRRKGSHPEDPPVPDSSGPFVLNTSYSVPGFASSPKGETLYGDKSYSHSEMDTSGLEHELKRNFPSKGTSFTKDCDTSYTPGIDRQHMQSKLAELELKRSKIGRDERLCGHVIEYPQTDVTSTDFQIRKVPFHWHKSQMISSGTQAKVYSAMNRDTWQRMAVKEIKLQEGDRERQKRLVEDSIHETETLIALNHCNILRYFGIETTRSEVRIFTEFCDGGTLAALVKNELPMEMIRTYTRSLLSAVNYLHEAGIVHRDIKPSNIFIWDTDKISDMIKLGDFGTAIRLCDMTGTMTGELTELTGTVHYMAPEVCVAGSKDSPSYGRSCDVWSLGCVVLEMITCKMPWSELETRHSIIFTVGRGQAPFIPKPSDENGRMNKDAHSFLKLCFVVDPKKRCNAGKLLDDTFVKHTV